jgi:hypothetical protein
MVGIYRSSQTPKEAIRMEGVTESQGDGWANSLREGDPTTACYIGELRPYAHVMLKV